MIERLKLVLDLDKKLLDKLNVQDKLDEKLSYWLKDLSRECEFCFLEELKKLKDYVKDLEDMGQIKTVELCIKELNEG